jgi:hypothetical protein
LSDKIYTPAMAIENKPQAEGVLGCFAQKRGDPGTKVLLSNAHILFGQVPEQTNVRIYQPPSGSTCCRKTHIATTLNTWEDGFLPVEVRLAGETEVRRGSETDCAIARLVEGIQFTNQIPEIGMIAGTPPAGDFGITAGPPFGTAPREEQYVRFYSPLDNRVHYGTVLTLGDSATYVSGGTGSVPPLLSPRSVQNPLAPLHTAVPPINQLLILPRPTPGESYERYLSGQLQLYFGRTGDSGSVVVNHENKVIGLMCWVAGLPESEETAEEWRAVSGIGVLNPIHKVLDQMEIEIPSNLANTSPSRGGRFFMPGVETDPDEIALERGRQRVEAKLKPLRLGRLLLGKMDQHRKEARRIVLGYRPALVAWHRHQGPAFVDHCVRNLRDPAHKIPTSINGIDQTALLQVMADMLIRYGSPKLRRDVEKYRDVILAHATGITSCDQAPEMIGELQRQRRLALQAGVAKTKEPV